MKPLPNFSTERLYLRPRELCDIPALLKMGQDPEVMRFVNGPVSDLVEHEEELRERISRDFGQGLGYWSVFPRDDHTDYLGWILLIPLDSKGPEIEIGWRFSTHSWGHGYATEAARAILEYSLQIGISPIAVIKSENLASIRLAERLGMTRNGTLFAYKAELDRYELAK